MGWELEKPIFQETNEWQKCVHFSLEIGNLIERGKENVFYFSKLSPKP